MARKCNPGEEGELVHRGALVAMGYWNDPERTAERFRPAPGRDASWRTPEIAVWSGDVVVADEEGYLYFIGRKDEMIKTSGYRVSPTEIEEEAYATGLVRDAVALGVEDAKLGQRILLVASPLGSDGLDEAALIAAMKRKLPLYMVPSVVVVREEIPTVAERQVRPRDATRGARFVTLRPTIAAFGLVDGQLAVGGIPLKRLADRVGATPFFAYDRALLTARVELLRSTLPTQINLSYAVKANPMPAVVQHLAGLVDFSMSRRRWRCELRWTRQCAPTRLALPAPARPKLKSHKLSRRASQSRWSWRRRQSASCKLATDLDCARGSQSG